MVIVEVLSSEEDVVEDVDVENVLARDELIDVKVDNEEDVVVAVDELLPTRSSQVFPKLPVLLNESENDPVTTSNVIVAA